MTSEEEFVLLVATGNVVMSRCSAASLVSHGTYDVHHKTDVAEWE